MKNFVAIVTALAISTCHATSFGIVNFMTVVNDSKYGKQEQAQFEQLSKQMEKLIKDVESQLQEIAGKLNDTDYLDSISPEAEKELKMQFGALQEEMQRYQQQAMQTMQQANMRIIQSMSEKVGTAAKKIAEEKHLAFVMNKDAVFYYDPKNDVTQAVIQELDTNFAKEEKK